MKYTRRNIYRHLNEKISFSKKLMLIGGLLTLLITAVSLISPYLYKTLVDDVMTAGNINLLYYVIPAMIGVYLVKVMLTGIRTYVNKKFSYATTLETKNRLMQKFLERDISMAAGKEIGTQSNNLEQDSGAVHTFLSSHIVGFVTSFIVAAIYMALMININVWLGLLSVILLPLTIWFSQIIGNKYNAVNKESYEVKSKTKTHLFDTVQKWREIKTNTLEDQFSAEYDERLEPERKLNNKWMFYYALRDFFYEIKTQFVLKVLIYFVGGLFVISKDITIGDLLMFISFMASMESALDSIMRSKTDFLGQKAVFDRLFKILDEPEPNKGADCSENATIYLKNVDFAYSEESGKVLEQVSCEFAHGKKYLLVGKSGEGKSTLIKLLLGLNKPQAGQLLFENTEIFEIDSQCLLTNVGTVMQENMFFNLSIRDNLQLIAPKASEDDLIFALKTACLYDFVDSLPQKIDTVIGERGVKLSGGQKQRLAIARLILHNPQIIILDEATSALDSIVESEILDNLSNIFSDRTMIVISHKPIVNFKKDETYLVENKRIVKTA
ncbi:MAG: ABC transporter ATP-binding protein [Clostridia bacterium]|nr:ABC transporter ATP-binding protein [Clostridia bacterium]